MQFINILAEGGEILAKDTVPIKIREVFIRDERFGSDVAIFTNIPDDLGDVLFLKTIQDVVAQEF